MGVVRTSDGEPIHSTGVVLTMGVILTMGVVLTKDVVLG